MNARERLMAMILLPVLLIGVAVLLYFQVYRPMVKKRTDSIARLKSEIDERLQRKDQAIKDKQRLDRYRQLSLPMRTDLSSDQRDYVEFLTRLAQHSGFRSVDQPKSGPPDNNSSPKLAGKKDPIYTVLPFDIKLKGSLYSCIDIMTQFYKTGLLHRIKGFEIKKPGTPVPGQQTVPDELEMLLKVEALVVAGAEDRSALLFPPAKPAAGGGGFMASRSEPPLAPLPLTDRRYLMADAITVLRHGPAGIALVPWIAGPAGPSGPHLLAQPERDYEAAALKNVFFGRQKTDTGAVVRGQSVTPFVHLVDITHWTRKTEWEAWFWNRYTNAYTRLRTERGFDQFDIRDSEGEKQVTGKVIQMDDRDLIFQVEEKYYSIHVGQDLEQAMKKALKDDVLKAKGILKPAAADKKEGPAKETKPAAADKKEEPAKDAKPVAVPEKKEDPAKAVKPVTVSEKKEIKPVTPTLSTDKK